VQENFELTVPRGVPPAQRFDLLGRRARRNITALHGEKPRIAHWWAVRRFYIALCQLGEIDLVEN